MNQIQRGQAFQQLHQQEKLFLMPNAWDIGSAIMLASLGFSAIATTSAGICFSLGLPDTEEAIGRSSMLERVASMATQITLPFSADLQSGFGSHAIEVGSTIRSAIAAGVVGANIEDYYGNADQALFPEEIACARIQAARQAADHSGIPFVLTARTDIYLTSARPSLSEVIHRCNAYRAAGADCLFVPGASDPQTIATLVNEIDAPLSVVMGFSGSHLSVKQLEDLGVRRVTIGGSLARASFGLIKRAAAEISESGTFSYADQQINHAELSQFFTHQGTR